MLRSVEYARNHGVPLHVRSSFSDAEGTWVVSEEESLEQAIISGIAHDTSEAKVTILGVPDQPGIAARVFRPLADAGVNVDMIVQNVSAAGAHGHLVHAAEGRRPGAPSAILAAARRRGRGGRRHVRPRHREGLAHRRRDEEPSGRRRRHVRRARGGRHEHRDHLDVVDPRLVRHPRGRRRACRARGARPLRPRRRRLLTGAAPLPSHPRYMPVTVAATGQCPDGPSGARLSERER